MREIAYRGHLLPVNEPEERFFVGLLEQFEWEEISQRECAKQAETVLELKRLLGAKMVT